MSRRRTVLVAILGLAAALLPLALAPGIAAAGDWTHPNRVVAAIAPLSTDLAIDGDGFLHVAYLEDYQHGGLRYATNRGGWHSELVAADVGFEAQPSIAVDPAGHVFIAFAKWRCPAEPGAQCVEPEDEPISRIHVASNSSGTWSVHARSAGPGDMWPSLAIAGGHLQIAFQRQLWPPGQAGSGVWLLTNAGGWHESQVASGQGRCYLDQIPSIAVTPAGQIWIAYEAARRPVDGCGGSAGIRIATPSGAGWTRATVTTDRDDVQPVLALDRQARPALIFDRQGTGIRFSRRIGGAWTSPQAVSAGAEGDLVFDPQGHARVAAEGGGGIQVATRTPSGFVRTTVYHGPVDYGTYGGPGIVLDPTSGLARIVFGRSEPDETPLEDELGLYLVRQKP